MRISNKAVYEALEIESSEFRRWRRMYMNPSLREHPTGKGNAIEYELDNLREWLKTHKGAFLPRFERYISSLTNNP